MLEGRKTVFISLVLTAFETWIPEEQTCSGYRLWEEMDCPIVLAPHGSHRRGKAAGQCHWLSPAL